MSDPGGGWRSRYRLVLVVVILVVTVAITTVSTLLVASLTWRWSPGPVLTAVTTGITVVLSGIMINFLPRAVQVIWRPGKAFDLPLGELLGRLGSALGHPVRITGVVMVTTAIAVTGLYLRPAPTGLEPGELVIMTAFSESASDPRSVLIDQWNQLHPENPVEIRYAPGEPDQQNARMVRDAAPDGAHEADIYILDIVWMAQFIDNGYIRQLDRSSLSELDLADFIPVVRATCERDGGLWALPFNTDAGLLYSRSDVPGLPRARSWDDYFGSTATTAAQAARSAGVDFTAVNAAQFADEEILTITALEAIWAAGGDVVGPNGEVAMNADDTAVFFDQPSLDGIKKLAAAVEDPELVPHEDGKPVEWTDNAAASAFGEGQTLYMRNWPVARDSVAKRADNVDFEVTASDTPTVLGGQNLALSAQKTDKSRAAQALIEFLTNPSSQLILAETGGFAPTRHSAFSNSTQPGNQELRSALDKVRLRPVHPHYTEFSKAFRQGINRALRNNGELEPGFAEELAAILNK